MQIDTWKRMTAWELVRRRIRRLLGAEESSDIHYIGGSDVLPPPLDSEEEHKALIAFMEGSEEARAMLIEHNLRLVVYIAQKNLKMPGVNVEDLNFYRNHWAD